MSEVLCPAWRTKWVVHEWVSGLSVVVADETDVGRPVFVAGLLFGVDRSMFACTIVDVDRNQKLKTQNSLPVCGVLFYNVCPSLGQRPGISLNGFLWVIELIHPITVGDRHFASRYRLYSFGLKLPLRLKLPLGNSRCRSVVFSTTVATMSCIAHMPREICSRGLESFIITCSSCCLYRIGCYATELNFFH